MPRRQLAATVALLLLVSACSDGDDAADSGAEVTTTTVASDAHDDEGIGELQEVAAQLLVTADELGVPGLVDGGFTPGPCNDDIDEQHPPDVRVGLLAVDDATGLSLGEELRVYPGIEESATAYDAGVFGLCDDDAGGPSVSDPVDVTDEVGADAAKRVDITGETESVLVVAVVGDTIASFVITGPPGAAATAAVDPLDVAAFGVGKILAALEAE